ncbi:MAG: single-stranded DNA-binding protein [Burkholderiales bacterium]|nr:single-stranded DNA-binding protein [Phycisphaerae bacterium]
MADVNKVMLIGRLTRDPQLKFTPSNLAVCEFGLAVGRKFKTATGEQREETNFIDCTLFGKGGEIFNQYMTKGKQVFLEGRLKFDSWEDKQGGGKRSKLSVVVEEFQFLDNRGAGGAANSGPPDEEGGQSAPPRQASRPAQRAAPQQAPPQAPYGEEQKFSDDDIPF